MTEQVKAVRVATVSGIITLTQALALWKRARRDRWGWRSWSWAEARGTPEQSKGRAQAAATTTRAWVS